MAKAKKPSSSGKKKSSPSPNTPPVVDTDLAAEAAARMLLARRQLNAATTPSHESTAFKQMKQSLDKSHLRGVNKALGTPSNPSGRPGGPNFGAQSGRNQTFGADVNRAGIPRRTNG